MKAIVLKRPGTTENFICKEVPQPVIALNEDALSKKYSAVADEYFDISRKDWKIIGAPDSGCYNILDGDPDTQWYQDKTHTMPVDLIIDFGKENNISGFKYLPDQHWWGSGIITNYILYVSADGKEWKQTDKGEFSNIKNNPVWQTKNFPEIKGRYIRLQALQNTQGDNRVGYAEVGVITSVH